GRCGESREKALEGGLAQGRMDLLMVFARDGQREPGLQFGYGQDGPALRIIGPACVDSGKRGPRQLMHHGHQGAKDPLHYPTKMRPCHRPMREGNAMLVTAFAERLAMKLLGVVDIETARFPRNRPVDLYANPFQPGVFGHGSMREAEPHRGGGWRVQGEAYAC